RCPIHVSQRLRIAVQVMLCALVVLADRLQRVAHPCMLAETGTSRDFFLQQRDRCAAPRPIEKGHAWAGYAAPPGVTPTARRQYWRRASFGCRPTPARRWTCCRSARAACGSVRRRPCVFRTAWMMESMLAAGRGSRRRIGSPACGATVDETGTMERRDAIVLLLLLSGGGDAAYNHWDAVSARLGLDDLHSGRIKAMELVKKSYDIDRHCTNGDLMRDRAANGDIVIKDDPWQADPTEGTSYRVTCTYTENGTRCC